MIWLLINIIEEQVSELNDRERSEREQCSMHDRVDLSAFARTPSIQMHVMASCPQDFALPFFPQGPLFCHAQETKRKSYYTYVLVKIHVPLTSSLL